MGFGCLWMCSWQCCCIPEAPFPSLTLLFPHSHLRAAASDAVAAEHPGVLAAAHRRAVHGHPAGLLDVPAPQASLRPRGHH